MLRGTNIVKARLNNLWVVFEAVRIHGPLPRVRISEMTGLSKQATSDLIDELLVMDFVREERSTEKRIGKPPKPVSINAEGAFTIGLHVDFGQMDGAVMNLGGDVLAREGLPLVEIEPYRVASELARMVQRLLERAGLARNRFHGIGLATPGPFGVAGINPPRLPGWDGIALTKHLREATGLPVALANDGQCAVTAEWRFGAVARTLKNFVYIYLGNGLGTGIMIDGAAFGGAHGNAGEFGHTISAAGGPLCVCGKRGCLETYVSLDSLTRFLNQRGIDVSTPDQLNELTAGHPAVAEWIESGCEPLRNELNALENLFDPETIMLGGDAPGWLIDAFIDQLQPLHPSISRVERQLPRLMKADLGSDAVIRGSAILPLLGRLNPHYQELSRFA